MAHLKRIGFVSQTILWFLILVSACGSVGQATEPAIDNESTLETTPTADVSIEATCPTIVMAALETTHSACNDTGRNQACYGNIRLDVEAQDDAAPFTFEEQGDKVDLAAVQMLTLSSMNETRREWGVALLKVQADLPDTLPGQNVTFLLFGDVEIEDATDDANNPMQSFRFRTGIGDSFCSGAPDSGILIQTPEGAGEILLKANGVDITLSSTAYLQAEAGEEMVVNLLEGQAEIQAQNVVQAVTAGQQVSVPIDVDLRPIGPPGPPHPYNLPTLQSLPVANLEQVVVAVPNASGTKVDITGEGSVEASSTYTGFSALMSVDGDGTTSWFSAGPGPDGSPSIYRWTGARDDLITTVSILSNAQHSEPDFRSGFGFGSATIQVLDADNNVVFEETLDLEGTPDPDVVVHPGVVGRAIVLSLTGHEDPTCGGFSELQIEAVR
jgi:hypothetical protein